MIDFKAVLAIWCLTLRSRFKEAVIRYIPKQEFVTSAKYLRHELVRNILTLNASPDQGMDRLSTFQDR